MPAPLLRRRRRPAVLRTRPPGPAQPRLPARHHPRPLLPQALPRRRHRRPAPSPASTAPPSAWPRLGLPVAPPARRHGRAHGHRRRRPLLRPAPLGRRPAPRAAPQLTRAQSRRLGALLGPGAHRPGAGHADEPHPPRRALRGPPAPTRDRTFAHDRRTARPWPAAHRPRDSLRRARRAPAAGAPGPAGAARPPPAARRRGPAGGLGARRLPPAERALPRRRSRPRSSTGTGWACSRAPRRRYGPPRSSSSAPAGRWTWRRWRRTRGAYRRAAGRGAAELAAAVHRVWWERLNDFWMLHWRYQLGDRRADPQFPAAAALAVWWTREYGPYGTRSPAEPRRGAGQPARRRASSRCPCRCRRWSRRPCRWSRHRRRCPPSAVPPSAVAAVRGAAVGRPAGGAGGRRRRRAAPASTARGGRLGRRAACWAAAAAARCTCCRHRPWCRVGLRGARLVRLRLAPSCRPWTATGTASSGVSCFLSWPPVFCIAKATPTAMAITASAAISQILPRPPLAGR